MRKLLVLLLASSLAACGGSDNSSSDSSSSTATSSSPAAVTSSSLSSASESSHISSSLNDSSASSNLSSLSSSNISSSLQASAPGSSSSTSSNSSIALSSSSAPSSSVPSSSTASASSVANACSGTAPEGQLTAQRIPGANTARSGLYEGPVWINGALYFSDFTWSAGFPAQIQRLDSNGVMTTAIADTGSNGLALDLQGDIVAGTHKYKSLSRFNLATGARASIAEEYAENVFNSPNDVAVARDGTIYFTDPDFQSAAAPGGQPLTRVYRVATNGTVTVVDESISQPNGIAFSPDEDVLYVNGGTPAFVRAYPMVNGVPTAGIDLVTDLYTTDGMTVDCLGNIYVTEHNAQQVRVFTSTGDEIATIAVDANVTNAAFGGAEGKTLYITGAGAVWKIELEVTGSHHSSSSSSSITSSSSSSNSSQITSSSSSSSTIEDFGAWSIEVMDTCTAANEFTGQKFTVFENTNNRLTMSWSHVGNNASEFANLVTATYSNASFKLPNIQGQADPSCNNAKTHTGTWVKKLADWDRQHANGANISLYQNIGNLESIVIEMKINSAATNIPSTSATQTRYGSLVTQAELAKLDGGKLAFGISLVPDSENTSSIRGETVFEIDQVKYADKWIRLTIPVDQMLFWTGQSWAKQTLNIANLHNEQAARLMFMPETRGNGGAGNHAQVLRNFMNNTNTWNTSNPPAESFKEMNISIKLFEVRYK